MFKLVHSLALLTVLYHMLVGCCCHHAHAHQPVRSPQVAPATCCSGHHHQHGEAEKPADSPQQPARQPVHCHGKTCVFVLPTSVASDRLVGQTTWLVDFCWVPPSVTVPVTTGFVADVGCFDPGLSVRIHLWHQILLI